jgi:hypothetical protein
MGKAKDWTSFLSEESKAREYSPLKELAQYLTIPGLISLGGGSVNLIGKKLTIGYRILDTFPLNMSMFEYRHWANSRKPKLSTKARLFGLSRAGTELPFHRLRSRSLQNRTRLISLQLCNMGKDLVT